MEKREVKKCTNCIYSTILSECDYNVKKQIINDTILGEKTIFIGEFTPLAEMRTSYGQCGPKAKLYKSKIVNTLESLLITILITILIFITTYLLYLMVKWLD